MMAFTPPRQSVMPAPPSLAQIQQLMQENAALRAKVAALESVLEDQKNKGGEDSLSRLLPRASFIREVARMVAYDKRYGHHSAMLVLRFDGLIAARTLLTQSNYDALLHQIADSLLAGVRSCDTVGRSGEEDFSVLLTRCNEADASKRAEHLISGLQQSLNPLLKGRASIVLRYQVKPLPHV